MFYIDPEFVNFITNLSQTRYRSFYRLSPYIAGISGRDKDLNHVLKIIPLNRLMIMMPGLYAAAKSGFKRQISATKATTETESHS